MKVVRILLMFLLVISTGGVYYQFLSTEINIVALILAFVLLADSVNVHGITRISGLRSTLMIISAIWASYVLTNEGHLEALDHISLTSRIVTVFALLSHYEREPRAIGSDLFRVAQILVFHGIANHLVISLFGGMSILWKGGTNDYETNTILYLFFARSEEGIVRNSGMFWEPGIFQLFVNIFLFIRLFVHRQSELVSIAISAALLLSMQSTMGILIFGLIVSIYYFDRLSITRHLIGAALLGSFAVLFAPNVEEKLVEGTNPESYLSFQVRMFDAATGLYAAMERPFLGHGYSPRDNSMASFKPELYEEAVSLAGLSSIPKRGNTNSIVTNFVYWGLPMGLTLLYWLYRQSLLKTKRVLFFIINIMTCLSEPLLFSGLYVLFALSGAGVGDVTRKQ